MRKVADDARLAYLPKDRRALRLPRTARHEQAGRASPGRNTGMKKAPGFERAAL